jgi:anaerobic ribonucleoside-triphosphate reductase activating protein
MNIHAYKISRVNGPGNRFTLWTQGCSKGCSDCFNPETWSYKNNISFTPLEIFEHIKELDIDGVTITGGDPLEQERELLILLKLLDTLSLSKGVILFSGFTYDEIRADKIREECCSYIDVLIDGRYEKDKRISSGIKGSSNQNVIYFSSKIKEEELLIDQEVEVCLEGDIISVTGFPSIDRKFLKQFGVTVKSSI